VSKSLAFLILFLLLAACFALATTLQPRVGTWSGRRPSDSVLKVLLGDGRRLFANHFFVKADVYFHSGYYPSIFDQAAGPKDTRHLTSQEGEPEHEENEKHMDFLGPPRDWVERFGRHFLITKHTHLEGGNEREILPWLRLSAELDPQRVDTYTVAAFWLRVRLGKVKEADEFLREGLQANPNSYEILFELGRLYHENYHDPVRARNVWELALRYWREQEPGKKTPDNYTLDKILVNLAHVEEEQGNLQKVIEYLEQAKAVSPGPDALQKQIDDLRRKLSAPAAPPGPFH
jgi:tetratricopeptide (TPR) repeat protein